MTVIGLWPVKLTKFKLSIYNAYFYICFCYYIAYDLTQASMVFISKGNFLETADNLGVIIVYLVNIYKVLICRSRRIKSLIERIANQEGAILENADGEIRKIYRNHVRSAFISAVYYVSLGSAGISLYFVAPILKNWLEEREQSKYLIFRSWFPFNTDKYYWPAYAIQLVGGFIGYSYIVYPGTFMFCLLKFCVGQLKILQHILRNVTYYSEGFAWGKNREEFVKSCIREHQKIIKLIEDFDESMRTFILLDFVISSFQLSLVVYGLLESNGLDIARFAILSYFITLCSQLFIFYWNAHEIFIESTNLAAAIFESQWFDLEIPVQKMLAIMMLRAQKPLSVSIGPLYKIRIDALIGIFKAIYSYVAVIRK
ncbi:odorant receptor Or2-like [Leptinotarsa decemlineata]|uniref:odorant receptor Or2-like n=1 Tax=Leptinotarsa decemlineata TaxID=7539 RepID=UPI003D30ADAC